MPYYDAAQAYLCTRHGCANIDAGIPRCAQVCILNQRWREQCVASARWERASGCPRECEAAAQSQPPVQFAQTTWHGSSEADWTPDYLELRKWDGARQRSRTADRKYCAHWIALRTEQVPLAVYASYSVPVSNLRASRRARRIKRQAHALASVICFYSSNYSLSLPNLGLYQFFATKPLSLSAFGTRAPLQQYEDLRFHRCPGGRRQRPRGARGLLLRSRRSVDHHRYHLRGRLRGHTRSAGRFVPGRRRACLLHTYCTGARLPVSRRRRARLLPAPGSCYCSGRTSRGRCHSRIFHFRSRSCADQRHRLSRGSRPRLALRLWLHRQRRTWRKCDFFPAEHCAQTRIPDGPSRFRAHGRSSEWRRVQGDCIGTADSCGLRCGHVLLNELGAFEWSPFRESTPAGHRSSSRALEGSPGWST